MAAGLEADPADTKIRHIAIIGKFMDQTRALRLNRKLLEAERIGALESIEEYIDFQLSKKAQAGRVPPALNETE